MHGRAAHKELEVKLALAPASIPALRKTPHLRTLKMPPTHAGEVSVYFDTDKHKLRKSGFMLRVRRAGSRYTQTIKANGNSAMGSRGRRANRSRVFAAGREDARIETAMATAMKAYADFAKVKPFWR